MCELGSGGVREDVFFGVCFCYFAFSRVDFGTKPLIDGDDGSQNCKKSEEPNIWPIAFAVVVNNGNQRERCHHENGKQFGTVFVDCFFDLFEGFFQFHGKLLFVKGPKFEIIRNNFILTEY